MILCQISSLADKLRKTAKCSQNSQVAASVLAMIPCLLLLQMPISSLLFFKLALRCKLYYMKLLLTIYSIYQLPESDPPFHVDSVSHYNLQLSLSLLECLHLKQAVNSPTNITGHTMSLLITDPPLTNQQLDNRLIRDLCPET